MSDSISQDASIRQDRGRVFRWAGYLLIAIAVLSSLEWLATIRGYYVMEHEWPAATGTVYGMTEQSRDVAPVSLRQRQRTTYYWAQFDVLLQLPREQCPGDFLVRSPQQIDCLAVVRTPSSTSPADVRRWFLRHPVNSTVTIHYNVPSGKFWMGGESPLDIYPWNKIVATFGWLALAAVLFFAGRKVSSAFAPDSAATDRNTAVLSLKI